MLTSLPESLHKSRLRFYKSKSSFHKSRTCFYKSQSCEIKSGSSPCKSRMCEGKPEFCEDKAENLWRQVSEICGSFFCCSIIWLARIYLYTYIMFGKSIHPFTGCSFYIDFHQFCVWRLAPWSIHASVSCCEHFTPLPFTPETTENQRETSILWTREHFFR